MKVLGSVNANGENKQLGVEKDGELYKYILGSEVVGVFDPDIMADTLIVFRENTLERYRRHLSCQLLLLNSQLSNAHDYHKSTSLHKPQL